MSQPSTHRINGKVVDRATGDGIANLLVKCWDADLLFDDLIGSAPTNAGGVFFMEFDMTYFQELFFDRRPDLYFELYFKGRCIYTTKDDIHWNVDAGETEIVIEIDLAILGEDTPTDPIYPDPRQYPDVPADDPVHPGPHIDPPPPGQWQDDIRTWWAERKRQRAEDGTLHIPVKPIPKPYLDCTSNFGPQLNAMGLNEPGFMTFEVWNDGNFPSWTCYAELYEGPFGYNDPLSNYEFRGRTVLTLRPGERVNVAVPWIRKRTSARVVGIVFDPLLDPKDFALVEQRNRHITSIHYTF